MKFSVKHFLTIWIFISIPILPPRLRDSYLIDIIVLPASVAQSLDNQPNPPSDVSTENAIPADLGSLAKQAVGKMQASEENWRDRTSSKIIGHLKGKQGKLLVLKAPTVNQLLPDQLIPNVSGIPLFKEKFKTGDLFNDSEIPNCKNSKSEIKKVKESLLPDGPHVLIDSMYLDSNFLSDAQLQKDYKDLFGPNVSITFYRRGEANVSNGLLKASGIPCLPYRIRLTTGATMRLSGRDALKNFEDPKSSGKFHPLVAEAIRRLR